MHTTTIGEILREYREYHKMSLLDLSKKTRIKVSYLQALEQKTHKAIQLYEDAQNKLKLYENQTAVTQKMLDISVKRLMLARMKLGTATNSVVKKMIAPPRKNRGWTTPVFHQMRSPIAPTR